MANRKQGHRAKPGRKRRNKSKGNARSETTQPSTPSTQDGAAENNRERQRDEKLTLLTHLIRFIGIAPIAVLVLALALHDLWPWRIPQSLQPLVDMEIAVLTLSAGHAGIIGLLISSKGRLTWSIYPLLIAALATLVAGNRTVGDSTPGQFVAVLLFFLMFPAVWPEAVSAWLRSLLSIRGAAATVIGIALGITAFFQARDEDYVRDWILIPLAILIGFILSLILAWTLLQLSYRYVQTRLSRSKGLALTTYRKITRSRNKGRARH